jgi:hypothetical protein
MKKITIIALTALTWSCTAGAAPILAGFDSAVLPRCDDCTTATAQALGFTINFQGQLFSSVYVNNNGNVTFGARNMTYQPTSRMADYRGAPIIAPFYADVDTINTALPAQPSNDPNPGGGFGSGSVTYGQGSYTGASGIYGVAAYTNAKAFGVTWKDVAGYGISNGQQNKANTNVNTFQLLLIENSLAPGAFEIMFNEQSILWDKGIATNSYAIYGFSDGIGSFYYDGIGSATHSLINGGASALNTMSNTAPAVAGQYTYLVSTAQPRAATVPEPATLGLVGLGALALLRSRRRRA